MKTVPKKTTKHNRQIKNFKKVWVYRKGDITFQTLCLLFVFCAPVETLEALQTLLGPCYIRL